MKKTRSVTRGSSSEETEIQTPSFKQAEEISKAIRGKTD